MKIPLTQHKIALVDAEDYEKVMKFKWYAYKICGIFYAGRHIYDDRHKRIVLGMHTYIMGDPPSRHEYDHIDGDGLNNHRDNLRCVTHRQNQQNRHEEKTSQYPGVSWHKASNKWCARIGINGKTKNLGLFGDEEEAYLAYKKAVESNGERLK